MNRTDLIRHRKSHDLPEGWSEATVGQVAEDISYGFTAKASSSETGPRYLRITDLQNGTVDWGSVPSCRIPKEKIQKYVLRRGDLVFARTGATTGKSFLVRSCPEAVFASYLIRVRPSLCVLPEFLAWFFQTASYRNQISENIAGSAQPNCNATKLASLNLPIPPLDEQRRIVAKLEELLGKVDACQKRLAKIPVILKRFRQSVLAVACSGRLTADWRNEDTYVDGLPESWRSNDFGELIAEGPQNGLYKPQSFYGKGTLILRIDNFYDGSINSWDSLKRLKLSSKEVEQFGLADGDILINRVNSIKFLGKSAIVKNLPEACVFESNMMRCRLRDGFVRPGYAILYLRSSVGLEELRTNAKHAVNQSSINQDDVKSISFSLPPLSEQQEIVRRVEALFKFADQIEARYQKAQVQVDKLTQSILAKAFRGELVPTEAELARREGR